jgi:hypothetical protein
MIRIIRISVGRRDDLAPHLADHWRGQRFNGDRFLSSAVEIEAGLKTWRDACDFYRQGKTSQWSAPSSNLPNPLHPEPSRCECQNMFALTLRKVDKRASQVLPIDAAATFGFRFCRRSVPFLADRQHAKAEH